MDNIDCLKELTKSIVKKQNDSLESLKKLSQATDIVSSDISNLINSLQMVGNRQFAENRVQDDEPLAQVGSLTSSPQVNKNASLMSAHDLDGNELNLRTILLKAIKLLPPEKEEEATEEETETEKVDDCVSGDNETMKEVVRSKRNYEVPDRSEDDKIIKVDEKEDPRVGPTTQWQAQEHDQEKERNSSTNRADDVNKRSRHMPLDRERVADILKKYSLYDDDEDDDDDDDDDDGN